MVNLAERYARITCPTCKGTCKLVIDVSERVDTRTGYDVYTRKETTKCLQCDGGYIINEEYLKVAEEALAARRSLAEVICEGLKLRGFWVPNDLDSSDVINAVFNAIDKLREQAKGKKPGWGT